MTNYSIKYIVDCKKQNNWEVLSLLKIFLMLIMYFIDAVHIPHECHSVVQKAKAFNNNLYQLMIEDSTERLIENKKLRLHIALKREISFTACGFFPLDYTLIHAMAAAATTYLVILIQLGPSTLLDQSNSTSLNTSTSL